MTAKRATALALGGFVVLAVAAALLLGWRLFAADGVHRLDAGDDGAVIEMEVGEQVLLRLEGNITTGWAWQVVSVEPTVLAPAGEPDYETSSDADGAGGTYSFRFDAVGAGETQVVLEYGPSWDSPEAVPQSFSFTAVVG